MQSIFILFLTKNPKQEKEPYPKEKQKPNLANPHFCNFSGGDALPFLASEASKKGKAGFSFRFSCKPVGRALHFVAHPQNARMLEKLEPNPSRSGCKNFKGVGKVWFLFLFGVGMLWLDLSKRLQPIKLWLEVIMYSKWQPRQKKRIVNGNFGIKNV